MKDWVSIALLFSFLRLQLVCCCGSVGHFVASERHAAASLVACCSHETKKDCGHSKTSCESREHSCDCAGRDNPAGVPIEIEADISSAGSVVPVCPCCGRSGSEHHHPHHLYWLTHGNIVPSSKVALKNLYDPPSLTVSCWGTSAGINQHCEPSRTLSFPPEADLLVLLGHWRI